MASRSSAASKSPASTLADAAASARAGALRSVERQHRGALQERRRCGESAPRLRPAGRTLEFGGDVLIGSRRGVGPVPGASIGVQFRVGDLRQRVMHALPVLKRRRPVGRRSHQGMAKPHSRAELGQVGFGRGYRRVGTDPEQRGRAPYQRRIAGRLGRREQQQAVGSARAGVEPAPETLLDAAREPTRAGQPEPSCQFERTSARGATPRAPADCRGSRRRSDRAPGRPAVRSAPRRAARVHRPSARPETTSSGNAGRSSARHACREDDGH